MKHRRIIKFASTTTATTITTTTTTATTMRTTTTTTTAASTITTTTTTTKLYELLRDDLETKTKKDLKVLGSQKFKHSLNEFIARGRVPKPNLTKPFLSLSFEWKDVHLCAAAAETQLMQLKPELQLFIARDFI